jgi:hypothetical protein
MSYLKNLIIKNELLLTDKKDRIPLARYTQQKFSNDEYYQSLFKGDLLVHNNLFSDNLILDNDKGNIIFIDKLRYEFKITEITEITENYKLQFLVDIFPNTYLKDGCIIYINDTNCDSCIHGLYKYNSIEDPETNTTTHFLTGYEDSNNYLKKIIPRLDYRDYKNFKANIVTITTLTINNGEISITTENDTPNININSSQNSYIDIDLSGNNGLLKKYAIINITNKEDLQNVNSINTYANPENGTSHKIINSSGYTLTIKDTSGNEIIQLENEHHTEIFYVNGWRVGI